MPSSSRRWRLLAGLVALALLFPAAGVIQAEEPLAATAVTEDTTPPITTHDAPDGWSKSDVTVRLTATDDRSGVAATYWRIGSGSFTAGSVARLTAEGTHTLDFYSVDRAGNAEAVAVGKMVSVSVHVPTWQETEVDLIAGVPVALTATGRIAYSPTGSTWAGGTGAAPDGYLAPGLYAHGLIGRIGGGAPFNVGPSRSFVPATSGRLSLAMNDCDGCYGDNAGNWTVGIQTSPPTRATVRIDKRPPTGSLTIAGGAALTTSRTVALAHSAGDNLSGVARMRFSADGLTWEPWQPYVASSAYALDDGDGVKSLLVQFEDRAGNLSVAYHDSILLDATPPPVTIGLPPEGAVIDTGSPALSGTAEGSESALLFLDAVRENLALRRPTSIWPTSTADGTGERGVDGLFTGGAAIQTGPAVGAYWQVDLGVISLLEEVRLYNRLDCCQDRSRSVTIRSSRDGVNWQTVYTHDGSLFGGMADGRPLGVRLADGLLARWVRLQLKESNAITLDEVEVYGRRPTALLPVAGGQWQFQARDLADGPHAVQVYAADAAGNVGGAASTFTVASMLPTISGQRAGAPNEHGWDNGDVTVRFNCAGSGVTACTPETTLSQEGDGQSVTGTVTDRAGRSQSVTVSDIRIDKTAPTVSYSGNAGRYTIDQTILITCTASDALSGLASSTCADVDGPAYSFLPGVHEVSATATDRAGNTGRASASFTVDVTFDSLAGLIGQLLGDGWAAQSLVAKLEAAGRADERGHGRAEAAKIEAFRQEVDAQAGKKLTVPQADLLRRLSYRL